MSERLMVTCPGCDGVVSVSPTGDEAEVRCLKCDEAVYTRSAEGGEWWANVPVADPTAEKPVVVPIAPRMPEIPIAASKAEWQVPAGWVALGIGIAGFIVSYKYGEGVTFDNKLIAGLQNPLAFVGVPLGLYWLTSNATNKTRRITGRIVTGVGVLGLLLPLSRLSVAKETMLQISGQKLCFVRFVMGVSQLLFLIGIPLGLYLENHGLPKGKQMNGLALFLIMIIVIGFLSGLFGVAWVSVP